jgi:hypothetical protein
MEEQIFRCIPVSRAFGSLEWVKEIWPFCAIGLHFNKYRDMTGCASTLIIASFVTFTKREFLKIWRMDLGEWIMVKAEIEQWISEG